MTYTSPSTLSSDSEEYKRLENFAKLLEQNSPNGWHYYVGDTYFDYGQNWKWTVVLCECTDGDRYQALTPREWEEVINDKRPQSDIMKDLFNDKYCPDKIRGK